MHAGTVESLAAIFGDHLPHPKHRHWNSPGTKYFFNTYLLTELDSSCPYLVYTQTCS